MNRIPFKTLAIVAAVVLAGCSASEAFGLAGHDDASLIVFYGDTSQIVVPDTISRSTSFGVSFTTYGDGCTRGIARDDITTSSTTSEIRPFDHNAGGACSDVLRLLQHTVTLRLDTPGTVVIHLIGQQRGAGTNGVSVPAEIQRTVTVR